MSWGFDRGKPIDRYYVETFLRRNSVSDAAGSAISGRVLEVGDSRYTDLFSRPSAVTRIDVLDADRNNQAATIVADLAAGQSIPSDAFDCVICTQTLNHVYDAEAAVRTLHRIVAPGGSIFVTVPGISQACHRKRDGGYDYWRFTTESLRRMLEASFPAAEVTVVAYGNVLSATAFLYGLAAEELTPAELDYHDPDYQVIIAAQATKPTR